MNKKLLALLAVPVFALTSCNSSDYDVNALIDMARASLQKNQDPTNTYGMYDVVGTGHVVQYDCNPTYSTKNDMYVRYASLDETGYYDDKDAAKVSSDSLFLRMPLYIYASTFFDVVTDLNGNENQIGSFLTINSIMTSSIDSISKIQVEETEDGGLHFYSRLVQIKKKTFFNIDSAVDAIEVTTRFNFDLYYNNYGLLTREVISSDKRVSSAKEMTVDLEANYTYKAAA